MATLDLIVAFGFIAVGWIGGGSLLAHSLATDDALATRCRPSVHKLYTSGLPENRRRDTFPLSSGPMNERLADRGVR